MHIHETATQCVVDLVGCADLPVDVVLGADWRRDIDAFIASVPCPPIVQIAWDTRPSLPTHAGVPAMHTNTSTTPPCCPSSPVSDTPMPAAAATPPAPAIQSMTTPGSSCPPAMTPLDRVVNSLQDLSRPELLTLVDEHAVELTCHRATKVRGWDHYEDVSSAPALATTMAGKCKKRRL